MSRSKLAFLLNPFVSPTTASADPGAMHLLPLAADAQRTSVRNAPQGLVGDGLGPRDLPIQSNTGRG